MNNKFNIGDKVIYDGEIWEIDGIPFSKEFNKYGLKRGNLIQTAAIESDLELIEPNTIEEDIKAEEVIVKSDIKLFDVEVEEDTPKINLRCVKCTKDFEVTTDEFFSIDKAQCPICKKSKHLFQLDRPKLERLKVECEQAPVGLDYEAKDDLVNRIIVIVAAGINDESLFEECLKDIISQYDISELI